MSNFQRRTSRKFDTLRGKSAYEKALTVNALAGKRIKARRAELACFVGSAVE